MNNLEVNERIVKLCGWTIRDRTLGWRKLYISPTGRVESDPPYYTDSLDLCHEFEQVLNPDERAAYTLEVEHIHIREFNNKRDNLKVQLLLATPLQRCEAFLRLNNQWE